MKNKIFTTCLQGTYGDGLGEFNSTSHGVLRAERVDGNILHNGYVDVRFSFFSFDEYLPIVFQLLWF